MRSIKDKNKANKARDSFDEDKKQQNCLETISMKEKQMSQSVSEQEWLRP